MAPKSELQPTLLSGSRLLRGVRPGNTCHPGPHARAWILAAALAAAALSTAAATAGATRAQTLKAPSATAISRASTAIRDTLITRAKASRLLAAAGYWGGTFTAETGEPVMIYVSNAYPQDPALAQRWADFMAGLVHGSELTRLTMYLAPLAEVQGVCGRQAIACYSPQNSALIAPGDDPSANLSAEAVVTHEYGHHIASNRSHPPWVAVDTGTKRWASYENVCSRAASGELHPGAENDANYETNPGEAFAESYRVLNERRAGIPEPPWDVVTQSLYPDDTALTLLEQDVTTPWLANATQAKSGSFAKKGTSTRSYTIATPLDGTLKVAINTARGLRVALRVTSGGATLAQSSTICGQRSISVAVTRQAGSGAFTLRFSTSQS